MRVVIINDFSQARGGATFLALRSAELLAKRGHEVVVLCGDAGNNPALSALGVDVRGAKCLPLLKQSVAAAMVNGICNIRAAQFLENWISSEGRASDVYHLHGWSKIYSPSVFWALNQVWERLVVHAHDFFLACPNGAFWNHKRQVSCSLRPLSASCIRCDCDKRNYGQKLWRVSRSALIRTSLHSVGQIQQLLVLHPDMCERFVAAGFPRNSIRVLRNPALPYSERRIAVESNRKIVYIGRLEPEKGVLLLAQAAARSRVPLLIVGDGPLREQIKHIYPNAECVGWQDRSGLENYAKQARVLVMPSLYPEPFGLVAVEALSSGIPVVVSRDALISTEIASGDAGVAVDPRDVDALGNVLQSLASADSRVAIMSQNAVGLAPRISSTEATWCDELERTYTQIGRTTADGNYNFLELQ